MCKNFVLTRTGLGSRQRGIPFSAFQVEVLILLRFLSFLKLTFTYNRSVAPVYATTGGNEVIGKVFMPYCMLESLEYRIQIN